MNIIYMLLAISVVIALVFFIAFIISVRKGQYDDTYTPSVRILFDDEIIKGAVTDKKTSNESSLAKEQLK